MALRLCDCCPTTTNSGYDLNEVATCEMILLKKKAGWHTTQLGYIFVLISLK
jgi:hypothetical protein